MTKTNSRGLLLFVVIPIILLVVFSILIYLTSINSQSLPIDEWIIRTISTIEEFSLLYSAFTAISMLGSGEVILMTIVTIAIILFSLKRHQLLVTMLIINVGGVVLNFILKLLFVRDRPFS